MRPLTLEEVHSIGELVSRKLPVTAVVEWDYKVGRKSDSLNFLIKK